MIRVFLTDVDGVMTDAGMYYTESGDEFKKFNTHDGMAFSILRERGIKAGIITSEKTKIVENRAKKLRADYLYQGAKGDGKLQAALEICQQQGITLQDVAYIGDDINCIPLLESVGVAACPLNAVKAVKDIPGIIKLDVKGGDGAVRAFVDLLLSE